MRFVFMLIIKFYQAFTPKAFRGKCLFKESCSNYVYRITKEVGLKDGINSFLFRLKNCRPGYYMIEEADKILLITVKNWVVEEKDISEKIINEYKSKLHLENQNRINNF